MTNSPKKSCAGLIILLVSGIIGFISVIMMALTILTPEIFNGWSLQLYRDYVKATDIIAIVASLLSIIGVGVFIAEYRGHTP